MSELSKDRDYYRRMSTAEHKRNCPAAKRTGFVRSGCEDGPAGCNPPDHRALFGRLADELDAYLTRQAEDTDQPNRAPTDADQPLLED